MSVETIDQDILCEDGTRLIASIDHPDPKQFVQSHGAVVICGALGVPRQFYGDFGAFLADHGYVAIRFDYRGIGKSGNSLAGRNIRLEDWGRYDISAALGLGQELGSGRVFQIGHSCGGQLLGLASGAEHVSGAILVAATLANPRHYPLRDQPGLHFVWRGLIPLMSIGRDRFPARRLGLSSTDVPTGVMRQWAQWARGDEYLFSRRFHLSTHGYARITAPMLSLSFADDKFASQTAVRALDPHYSHAEIEQKNYKPEDTCASSLGHFGFFRPRARCLWQEALDWIWQQPNAATIPSQTAA